MAARAEIRRRTVRVGTPLMREWPSAVAGLTAVVTLLVMAWTTGGYFPAGHLPAGAAIFAVLALLAVARPPRWTPSSPALWALAALAGLAAWTGMSSRWSEAPHTALEDMQRGLVYLGLLGIGVVAAGRGRLSKHVVWGVLAVIVAVVGAGLVSRLSPDVLGYEGSLSPLMTYRLSYPLSYWNAFGALGAMGVVLSLGLAADPWAHPVVRGLAAALVVGLGTAAYLSFSRGAWLALAAGSLVLGLVTTRRGSLLATACIAVPLLLVAILRVDGMEALTTDPAAGSGQAAQGRAFLPVLLAVMAVAGVVQGLLAEAASRLPLDDVRQRVARPLAIWGLAALVVAGLGFYLIRSSDVEGGAVIRLEKAESFVERQWDEFMTPSEFGGGSGSSRLVTARGTRSDLYRVAFDGFEAQPLIGDGAGSFEYRFARDRDVSEKVRDAHSLFFETLGELGLVGGALLLVFIGALAAGLRRARRRRDGLTGAQVAAVAAACTVWLGHAAVDWAWQMPAVTGCALILASAALTGDRVRDGAGDRPGLLRGHMATGR